MNNKIIIILLLAILLLIMPVQAGIIDSKVDDKKILAAHSDSVYILHTVDFGDIEVTERDYQKVMINDTVTFDTESTFGLYSLNKINNNEVN